MWERWYHVLVDVPDGKRWLIAIKATSAIHARKLIADDFGDENIREVKSGGR